ncbi:uncharacterized protein LOC143422103 [Xylocopa sonorina]|uniref:uncharacterized protein LOC143422103 n=1 Tax=Xylocopa sonorina TaxID=1818115 RepID=UPI00403AC6D2
MDALELQAALVKLDPATTVTPIGSNVKMMPPPPPHHRIAFTVDLDENDLTLENARDVEGDEKSAVSVTQTSNASRKLHSNCSAQLTVPSGHQTHPSNQQIEVSKCEMAEVR